MFPAWNLGIICPYVNVLRSFQSREPVIREPKQARARVGPRSNVQGPRYKIPNSRKPLFLTGFTGSTGFKVPMLTHFPIPSTLRYHDTSLHKIAASSCPRVSASVISPPRPCTPSPPHVYWLDISIQASFSRWATSPGTFILPVPFPISVPLRPPGP